MDFLVGFTIFIFSLIVVANMVPSLLVGLQRTTAIDYDAVAYRTAVVLVEDPGEPPGGTDYYDASTTERVSWDSLDPSAIREDIKNPANAYRFGLAVSRATPNILLPRKIEHFFNTSFTTDDFRKLLIFGDIKYGYNISLYQLDTQTMQSVGPPYPEGRYGYIRRYVEIKNPTYADISNTTHPQFDAQTEFPSEFQVFRIHLNGSVLYEQGTKQPYSPAYVIDPRKDQIRIDITGFGGYLNNSYLNRGSSLAHNTDDWQKNYLPNGNPAYDIDGNPQNIPPTYATLDNITFTDNSDGAGGNLLIDDGPDPQVMVFITHQDGGLVRLPSLGPDLRQQVLATDSINITLKRIDQTYMNTGNGLYVLLSFRERPLQMESRQMRIPHTLLSGTFEYDYPNVNQPQLSPAILEVAIW